ncbi:CAPA peptides-like, partial [Melitaea cinxia]|uniref:CAPA peptides-like n=1 Tax=Melitaea cinxia TaxID=113334 RepID=UPI001E27376D
MQPIIIFSVVLLASVVASHSTKTLRRDGVLHLYPFPRIGRASERTWQVPVNDYQDHEQVKRQLYAFPRVGRNGLSQSDVQISPQLENMLYERRNNFDKRESKLTSNQQGMWFGPRLGRAYKKEIDDYPRENESNR